MRGMELLQRAEVLLNSGHSDAAVGVLRAALKCGAHQGEEPEMDEERQAARAARYTLALLHLCSTASGTSETARLVIHKEIDMHLRKLGFRYRLAREAFVGGGPIASLQHPPKHALQVVDNAIPPSWVAHLCDAFSTSSPFW